jgi:hypothetical protein
VHVLKADPALANYAEDFERMGLFVGGQVDTWLIASFETTISYSCSICAWETLPGAKLGETGKDASLHGAVDNIVAKAAAANTAERSETYHGFRPAPLPLSSSMQKIVQCFFHFAAYLRPFLCAGRFHFLALPPL